MDPSKELEEKLRQASSLGDEQSVRILLATGININAQHPVNGWTALHWASKRGHTNIISLLLKHGADKRCVSKKGESPLSICSSPDSRKLLGDDGSNPTVIENTLPIIPHYLSHPPLDPSVNLTSNPLPRKTTLVVADSQHLKNSSVYDQTDEMVLKVRVANISDPDFIEVDVANPSELTYSKLLRTCCEELGVIISDVVRVRKLPNTIIRNDKDVLRLKSFQELELVVSGLSKTVAPPSVANQPRSTPEESIKSLRPNGVLPFNPPGSGMSNNNYQAMGLLKNQTILY
ncbi:ankyrin repeat domain-containing protein 40-like [Ischnura elegans]|uniref:ankyrin repeat domain-containing protein 40-like n=1 Tax=Ischnura elegans TaxID=197161 RepID=UPI001ED88E40|nr:ankyrin repeat domain-containing protein 40-like [Ischnura elegans]XP_046394099.1 ankyrin repeat domain-containing protein 40-like [Ischnura elegans]